MKTLKKRLEEKGLLNEVQSRIVEVDKSKITNTNTMVNLPKSTINNLQKVNTNLSNPEITKQFNKTYREDTWNRVLNRANQIMNDAKYVGKKTGAGLLSGLTGIPQAFITDTANQMQKGENKKISNNIQDLIISLSNPNLARTKAMGETIKENIETLKNKDKTFVEKLVEIGTNTVSDASNMAMPVKQQINSLNQVVGKISPKTDENLLKINEKISEPSKKLNEKLEEERLRHGKVAQTIGDTGQVIGNMIPSIGTTVITKNPTLGLTTMGISAKGQSTQEALDRGAELDEAVRIGDTKAMIEIGTEKLLGGTNILGKGTFNDLLENGIVKKVENEVARFLVQQGINSAGEIAEETVSDLLGTLIDKGTVDENASYSWKDWGETSLVTLLSTTVLNILTGGMVGDISSAQNRNNLRNNLQQNSTNLTQEQLNSTKKDITQGKIETQEQLNQKLSEYGINQTATIENKPISEQSQQTTLPKYDLPQNQFSQVFEESAKKYQIDTNNDSVRLAKHFTDKANLQLDFEKLGKKTLAVYKNGRVIVNADAIKNNPEKVLQNIILHEAIHAKSGSKELNDVMKTVLSFVKSKGEYEGARLDLDNIYAEAYKGRPDFEQLMDEEVVTNTLGEYFGTEEGLNELINFVDDRTTLQKIYDFVKDILNRVTGYKDQEQFFRRAERQLAKALQSDYVAKSGDRFSIQKTEDGGKYVQVDTDQDIFEGKTKKEQIKIAHDYILQKFREQGLIKDNEAVNVTKRTANEYTHPSKSLPTRKYDAKIKASTELDNLLEISKYIKSGKDDGRHPFAKDGWDYYETVFKIGDKTYSGLLNIGKSPQGKLLYDITEIEERADNYSIKSVSVANSSSKFSIASNESNVNIKDNKGRTLSKEQQEYFKDSKVRDENGNLLRVYHGTASDFTMFDEAFASEGDYGIGFYFTDSKNVAQESAEISAVEKDISAYMNGTNKGKVMEQYLNIKNPSVWHNYRDIDKYKALAKQEGLSFYDYMRKHYDGIIVTNPRYSNEGNSDAKYYIAFNPEQIKNVDNLNPTDNPDIRYSLSQDQLEDSRYSYQTNGKWQEFVEKYFTSEGTKTKLGDIKLPQKVVKMKDFNDLLDRAINIPQADKKALKSELKGVDLTPESLNEFEQTVNDMDKAYKEINNEILNTNQNTTTRKATYNKYNKYNTEYDNSSLEKAKQVVPANKQGRRTKEQWLNVAKQIGTEIANKTNQEIEEIAYRTWQDEAPNQKSSLNRQGEKYVKFTSDEWIDTIYNTVKEQREKLSIDTNKQLPQPRKIVDEVYKEEIAEGTRTTKEQIGLPRAKEIPQKNVKNGLPQESVLRQNVTNSKKYTTKKETDTEIAKVLDTPVTRQKPKDRMWAIMKANILDKGIVFEDLSKRAKNRELEAKWDYTLTSGARAQNAIGNKRYDLSGNVISKGLTEIMDEVGDKINDFQNYMYHQLNVDRMTLKDRLGIDNKPVFGDKIGADYSQRKIAEYEESNPKFKEWAKDVYDYLKADKAELVKNGVISEELSRKFEELYPHYVPIQRADKLGNAINVPLDTRRTGINTPIKKAKGGSSDINPLFQTMANRTMQTYRASARNSLGVELKNTLQKLNEFKSNESNVADLDNIIETVSNEAQTDELLKASKDGRLPTFTVFENGNKVTFDISEDMYDALKPIDSSSLFNKTSKLLNTVGNLRRAVLTEYNPIFSLTNTIKDTQDVLLNSQHATKTYLKYPEAYWQILTGGYWKKEYLQNGGGQNTYFKDGDFEVKKTGKLPRAKDIITLPFKLPLKAISKLNSAVEMAPRLAEYIASREEGRSIQTSMLDASRVTTNFKAGGDLTKFANRNGATFLNAGVQGTMQTVRNIREANQKGLKGWAVLACKLAVAGAPVWILNHLMWEDDEDYEQLQEYVKDSYYIVGKRDDGTFIRIPKGRTLASIQKVVSNVDKYMNNKNELNIDTFAQDFWETLTFAFENVAPNNPIENNVLSPIAQVLTNTSWYGEDIVPERLQNVPKEEQFDETTDKFSKWLGEKLNVSPMKINYLLDQYGGGVSDILLPLGTPQAENTPLEDKFVTDPVMKSKYPGEFFEKADKLDIASNSMYATDTDIVKGKYMSYIQNNMSKLYKEKREIQNSTDSDKIKKEKLKEVQKQINETAKMALEDVENAKITSTTALIGNEEFYKNSDGEWVRIKDEDKLENVSMKSYSDYKIKKEQATDKKRQEKGNNKAELNDTEKIEIIKNSNYTDKEKDALFDDQINDKTYKNLKLLNKNNISKINQYMDYKTADLDSDKKDDGTKKGKTIYGSKEKKITEYLNNSSFSGIERIYLYGQTYKLNNEQRKALEKHIKQLKLTSEEQKQIYLDLASSNIEELSDGRIKWK